MGRPIKTSLKQYCIEHPEMEHLLKEFSSELNNFNTNCVGSGDSRTTVYWKCSGEHTWNETVYNRIRHKTGCPYCSGKKSITGVNDLQTVYPELCMDWDYSKNIRGPETYNKRSHDDVHWKCHKCGHGWTSPIDWRTRRGCPGCNKPNGTSYPELAIYYWIKERFPNAQNRLVVNKVEYDIYIPDLKLAIEYDGYDTHRNKKAKHIEKLSVAKAIGIDLLNIVECKKDDDEPMTRYSTQHTLWKYVIKGNYSNISQLIHSLHVLFNTGFRVIMEPLTPEILKFAKEGSQKKCILENSVAEVYKPLLKFWGASNSASPMEISKSSGEEIIWCCPNCGHTWRNTVHYMVQVFSQCQSCGEKLASFKGFIEDLNIAGSEVSKASIHGHTTSKTSFLELLKATIVYILKYDPTKLHLIVNNHKFIRQGKDDITTYLVSDKDYLCKAPKSIGASGLYIDSKISSKRALPIIKDIIEVCGYQKSICIEL